MRERQICGIPALASLSHSHKLHKAPSHSHVPQSVPALTAEQYAVRAFSSRRALALPSIVLNIDIWPSSATICSSSTAANPMAVPAKQSRPVSLSESGDLLQTGSARLSSVTKGANLLFTRLIRYEQICLKYNQFCLYYEQLCSYLMTVAMVLARN